VKRLLHRALIVSQHSYVRRLIEIVPDAERCQAV
jgi:hypothetical protein